MFLGLSSAVVELELVVVVVLTVEVVLVVAVVDGRDAAPHALSLRRVLPAETVVLGDVAPKWKLLTTVPLY